jgi:hypothetical protein
MGFDRETGLMLVTAKMQRTQRKALNISDPSDMHRPKVSFAPFATLR